jgi:hypothetical protein
MTTILKSEQFRNDIDTATIIVEQYADKGSVPLWRYTVKYDNKAPVFRRGLLHKPGKKWLRERF